MIWEGEHIIIGHPILVASRASRDPDPDLEARSSSQILPALAACVTAATSTRQHPCSHHMSRMECRKYQLVFHPHLSWWLLVGGADRQPERAVHRAEQLQQRPVRQAFPPRLCRDAA